MIDKSEPYLFLSPPHLGERERLYVEEAFESNWIAPVGPHVTGFEEELAARVGAAGAVALSSGTAALHLALRLLGVGAGDTVFCSTLTFVASANPILYQGAEPVFIDSEPESWNMSPQALARALAEAARSGRLPKAVIVVHLYGQSADMDAIGSLCEAYGVPIVEDAAESLGASFRGRATGTVGRFGVYSFNGNKIITTSGGGALVSNDKEALERARHWATQARDPAPYYQHSSMGYNYRLSNVLAGIGRGQLNVLDDRVEARRAVFDRYAALLSDCPGLTFMAERPYGRSSRWLTALIVDLADGISPGQLIDWLQRRSIEARRVWKPLHLQPLFRNAPFYPHGEKGSVAERLFELGICLPSGSSMNEDDQMRVIRAVKSWYRSMSTVAGL
jgi:pyridoxal phosphate-dependent aminotransferase EpsN